MLHRATWGNGARCADTKSVRVSTLQFLEYGDTERGTTCQRTSLRNWCYIKPISLGARGPIVDSP